MSLRLKAGLINLFKNMSEKRYKIGILGSHGAVGGALRKYFEKQNNIELFCYDKKGVGSMEEIHKADYIYVCLPTPYEPEIGCNTKIVEDAIDEIKGNKIIIIKSTVTPGTTNNVQAKHPEHKILFNPEFLVEESAEKDMEFPGSQIIGYTEQSRDVCADVECQLPRAPYVKIVPAAVAEFIKYARNTFLSIKVAKNNELYDLCKKFGLTEEQWKMVVDGMAADKRIGESHLIILHNGKRGYAGKCLPKDMKALLEFAKKLGINMPVSRAVDEYNEELLKK
jgi:UDPglucose 6-dehydrogenase